MSKIENKIFQQDILFSIKTIIFLLALLIDLVLRTNYYGSGLVYDVGMSATQTSIEAMLFFKLLGLSDVSWFRAIMPILLSPIIIIIMMNILNFLQSLL
jgi:hypothetical protein